MSRELKAVFLGWLFDIPILGGYYLLQKDVQAIAGSILAGVAMGAGAYLLAYCALGPNND